MHQEQPSYPSHVSLYFVEPVCSLQRLLLVGCAFTDTVLKIIYASPSHIELDCDMHDDHEFEPSQPFDLSKITALRILKLLQNTPDPDVTVSMATVSKRVIA